MAENITQLKDKLDSIKKKVLELDKAKNFKDAKALAEAGKKIQKYIKDNEVSYSTPVEALRSTLGSAAFEFGDEIEAGVRAPFSDRSYKDIRDELREKQVKFGRENPKLNLATEVGGSFLLPGATLAKGIGKASTLGGNIALGSGYGALTGAGMANEMSDVPAGAFTGGVTGGAVSGGLGLIGKAIAPQLQKGAQELRNQNVKLTPGQALGGGVAAAEETVAGLNIPFISNQIKSSRAEAATDFNEAAINKALKPLNLKVDPKLPSPQDKLASAQKMLSESYTKTLDKLTFKGDQNLASGFKSILNKNKSLNQDYFRKLKLKINDILTRSKDGMSGQQIKNLKEELNNIVGDYSSGLGADREFSRAMDDVLRVFDAQLKKQNKKYATQLSKTDKSYAGITRVENAMNKVKGEGQPFTPSALATAVKQGDKSARKRTYARGDALMQDLSGKGVNVLGNTVADSGTSGRLAFPLLFGASQASPEPFSKGILGAGAVISALYTKLGRNGFNALIKERPEILKKLGVTMADLAPLMSQGLLASDREEYKPREYSGDEDIPTITIRGGGSN